MLFKLKPSFWINRLLLFMLFVNSPSAFAQNNNFELPDSIASEKNDSLKIDLLLSAATSVKKAAIQLQYLHTALDLAQKNKLYNQQFVIHKNIARCYFFIGKLDSVISESHAALDLMENKSLKIDDEVLAVVCNNLGLGYSYSKNYPTALKYQLKALKIRERLTSSKLGSSYNNIGQIYMALEQHEKAINYFEKSLTFKKKNKDFKGIANTLNNLGIIYKNIRHAKKAKAYYLESLALSKEIKDKKKISNALNNLGQLAFWKDEYSIAISYYKESLTIAEQLGNYLLTVRSLCNIAQMYLELHQSNTALTYLEEAHQIAIEQDISIEIQDIYALYNQYYSQINNSDKASYYYLKLKKIQDSLEAINNRNIIAEIETKYETEKKEREIILLRQVSKIDQMELARVRSQRLWISGLSILLLIVVFILVWISKYRMKVNKELIALNSTKDKLLTIIGHDLKNPLIAFRSITQSLSTNIMTLEKSTILYFINKLEKSSNQLYLLVQNLLQWALNQEGGLKTNPQEFAVDQLVYDIFKLFKISAERKNISLIQEIPNNTIVFADIKMTETIFRNLIDNAIKFTPVTGQITISCKNADEHVIISVKDSGIGISEEEKAVLFDSNKTFSKTKASDQKGTGFGLLLCKELTKHIGSTLLIDSKVNEGTTFSFLLKKITHG